MKNSRLYVAGFVALVVLALLALSLSHLASGLQKLTGDSFPLSLFLAVGIDLGVLAAELALIVATLERIEKVKLAAVAVLSTSLVLSALLNGLSYTANTEAGSFQFYLCAVLGGFIPFSVMCLSKVAASLVIGETRAVQPAAPEPTAPETPGMQAHHAAAIAAHPPALIEAKALRPKQTPTKQAQRRRKARAILAKLPDITDRDLSIKLSCTEKTAREDRRAVEAKKIARASKGATSRTSMINGPANSR